MSAWQEILIATVSNTILLSVLGFLGRSLIQTWLTKDIKKFEYELKSKGDASIEQLKSQLQQAATEYQVRFVKLHEKRAEVIDKLHSCLVDVDRDCQRFVRGAWRSTETETFNKTLDMILNFYWLVKKDGFYLPERVCALLNTFIENIERNVVAVGTYCSSAIDSPQNSAILKGRYDAIMEAYEAFRGTIPEAEKALEDELRKMLGVEKSPLPGSSQT